MSSRSPMQHDFAKLPIPEQIPRTEFKMPFKHSTTFDFSDLVPVFLTDTLPGDTWRIKGEFLARISTLIRPIMSNMFLDVHWFYAPMRILWSNARAFFGENVNGLAIGEHNLQENDYLVPQIAFSSTSWTFGPGGLADYFGLPTTRSFGSQAEMPISLPFRMYHRIYNYWYRDRNWGSTAMVVPTDDGPDPITITAMYRRMRRFDYFTQALPWPQRGDSVYLPLGSSAQVFGDGEATGWSTGSTSVYMNFNNNTGFNGMMGVTTGSGTLGAGTAPTGTYPTEDYRIGGHTRANFDALGVNRNHLYADLSTATAINVLQFREAVATQHYLEREARIGSRYGEIILGRYGVDVGDNMLQEPEFLGSQTIAIDVRSVAQQSATSGSNPLGQLAAYSVTSGSGFIEKTTKEHGYLMCIVNARVDQVYQYGIRSMWKKRYLSQFYDPMFAHLGEQPLYNYEFYHTANDEALNNQVWGYIPRYDEYRHIPSITSGLFRSEASGTLDTWHTARSATALTTAANYIPDDSYLAVDRVIAVPSEPQVYLDCYLDIVAYRGIPAYNIPGLRRL